MMRCFPGLLLLAVSTTLLAADPAPKKNEYTIGQTPPAQAPVKAITMTAKKYEFDPAEVVIEPGTALTITLTALDRSHGFAVQGFDTCVDVDPKVGPVIIHFYIDKAGDYPFKCCHWCGSGHGKMTGMIKVEKK